MVQPTVNPTAEAGDISDGEAPAEPTSTLVLTTPAATFLDTRLTLPTATTPPAAAPLPNAGGPLARLDWAFSGSSESLPPADVPAASLAAPLVAVDAGALASPAHGGTGWLRVPRKRWNHVVDSRCAWGASPRPDEGCMFPVAGRPEACLEMGAMEKVSGSGVVVAYQELWVTVDARQVGNERGRQGMVLSLSIPDEKARGIVVRVGQFCQGLLMIDHEITLERWEYCAGPRSPGGGWQRVAKLGGRFLPCQWTFEGGRAEGVEVGNTLVDEKFEWKVEEKFAW
ncbi:uncharacterized protein LTHEOB_5372 [Neofusicoccum parvum]|uniref:Uncharacterized protein LTHEOB_5372 n=1 Tax=Neofusicoccum parvum TaxID=310453 RepID=A0ACB5RYB5_9PEZI|nr:uncharacterized protein LTHEOB_5372 [Neofusicoccum parvum]